jgi:hypothetical protein
VALGIALLVWAALFLSSASDAGSGRTFETRQPYDQVKRQAHEALPGTLARGLAGLALLWVGSRLLGGGRPEEPGGGPGGPPEGKPGPS